MNAFTVAQHLTAADIRNAEAIVDTDGTTWCQVAPGFGFALAVVAAVVDVAHADLGKAGQAERADLERLGCGGGAEAQHAQRQWQRTAHQAFWLAGVLRRGALWTEVCLLHRSGPLGLDGWR